MKNNIVPFQRRLSIYEEKLEYEWELLELIHETQAEVDRLRWELVFLMMPLAQWEGRHQSLRRTQERLLGYKAELMFLEFDWELIYLTRCYREVE
jgi:hypothetical protein